jgi:hypothetical protein
MRAQLSLWVLKPRVRWSIESLATGRRDIVGIGIIYQRWSKGMMRSEPSLTLLEESVDWTAHLSSHRRLSFVFRVPSWPSRTTACLFDNFLGARV